MRDKVFVLDFENLKRITSRIIIKLLTRFIKNVTHVLMITTSTYGSFSKLSYLWLFPRENNSLSLFQKSNKKGIFDLIRKAYELIEQH